SFCASNSCASASSRLQLNVQAFEFPRLPVEIGHLTGGVAHDFNNLLMAVLGSLNLLKKRLPADERSERLVTNAIQAA
ncbi:hypothetical protein ACCT11_36650, partial [Rhizobium johnstonii]